MGPVSKKQKKRKKEWTLFGFGCRESRESPKNHSSHNKYKHFVPFMLHTTEQKSNLQKVQPKSVVVVFSSLLTRQFCYISHCNCYCNHLHFININFFLVAQTLSLVRCLVFFICRISFSLSLCPSRYHSVRVVSGVMVLCANVNRTLWLLLQNAIRHRQLLH